MSVAVSLPPSGSPLPTLLLRRFTVDEYHQMIETGIPGEDEPVELLEGWVVIKMPRNPEHDLALEKSDVAIRDRLPTGWRMRIQCAITTDDSEPEPDIALVRGPLPSRAESQPRPGEVALVVEVAEVINSGWQRTWISHEEMKPRGTEGTEFYLWRVPLCPLCLCVSRLNQEETMNTDYLTLSAGCAPPAGKR